MLILVTIGYANEVMEDSTPLTHYSNPLGRTLVRCVDALN